MTEIGPEPALAGTTAVIDASEFTVKLVAARPPNCTAVAAVKLAPTIFTVVPTKPPSGVKEAILGSGTIVKFMSLVAVPESVVTEIGPVVAPAGTVAVI